MQWWLTPTQDSLPLAKFVKYGFMQDGPPTHVTSLLLRVIFRDILGGESFNMAKTFRNEFVRNKCDYPVETFGAPGWAHAENKNWSAFLMGFIISKFEKVHIDMRLLGTIKATQYGITINPAQLFAILELFNYATNTFITPDGER